MDGDESCVMIVVVVDTLLVRRRLDIKVAVMVRHVSSTCRSTPGYHRSLIRALADGVLAKSGERGGAAVTTLPLLLLLLLLLL